MYAELTLIYPVYHKLGQRLQPCIRAERNENSAGEAVVVDSEYFENFAQCRQSRGTTRPRDRDRESNEAQNANSAINFYLISTK